MGLLKAINGLVSGGLDPSKIVDSIGNVIDKATTSGEEKRAAELAMQKLRQQLPALQIELNKVEAGHKSIFISGWRPACGWVCVLGLAYEFFLRPLLTPLVPDLPHLRMSELLTLLGGMLGLASFRMREKERGVASQ